MAWSAQLLSHVLLFVTPWTVALQALLSMEFLRQECWIRLPFPSPGDLSNPEIKPVSLVAPALAESSRILYHHATWEALLIVKLWNHSFKYIQWNLNIIVVWYCHPHWNRWSCSIIHKSFIIIFELILPFSLFYPHVTYFSFKGVSLITLSFSL